MKKITFDDRLDEFLDGASQGDIIDMISKIKLWLRFKRFPLRVEIKAIEPTKKGAAK